MTLSITDTYEFLKEFSDRYKDKIVQNISKENKEYPIMKHIDMLFWQIGYELETSQNKEKFSGV